jgi:hypothetical protein
MMNEEGGRVGRVARESKNRSTIKRKSGRVKAEMLLVPLGTGTWIGTRERIMKDRK